MASVVIKPLDDAITAGDPIRAVIRNSVINQDGKTTGVTMPSRVAQESMIRAVYSKVGLDPLDTAYVEAHGTGTTAGDLNESGAIAATFGQRRGTSNPIVVGSIKTNIGHLESASGMAGVLKAVLILEKGSIPPSLNFECANEALLLDQCNIKVRHPQILGSG